MINIPGTVAYKCNLINRATNNKVGEGRGVATPKEKSSWIANTQVKICEKRALIDAVLSTFALSSRYTQDVEDMNVGNGQSAKAPYQPARPAYTPPAPAPQKIEPSLPYQHNIIRTLLSDTARDEKWLLAMKGLNQYKSIEEFPKHRAQKAIEQLQQFKDKMFAAAEVEKKEEAKEQDYKNDPQYKAAFGEDGVDPKTGEIKDAEVSEPTDKRAY
jgi:hypothetical protein